MGFIGFKLYQSIRKKGVIKSFLCFVEKAIWFIKVKEFKKAGGELLFSIRLKLMEQKILF